MRQMIRMLRADRRAMTRILSASVRLFLWVGIPETETSSVMVLVCVISRSFRYGDIWTAGVNLWLKHSLIDTSILISLKFDVNMAPGSGSSFRLKSKLVYCLIVLWLKTSKKWNAVKICRFITCFIALLITTNFKRNFMINIHFMNDWNLDLNLKCFMILGSDLHHKLKMLRHTQNMKVQCL